jgi:predicted enzyme related to lactoylglutathione lyase
MSEAFQRPGAFSFGGIMPMPPRGACALPHWGSYVTVHDVDATARHAEVLGAKTLVPPTDIPNVGRFCTFQDPQGAVISAITYRMT